MTLAPNCTQEQKVPLCSRKGPEDLRLLNLPKQPQQAAGAHYHEQTGKFREARDFLAKGTTQS